MGGNFRSAERQCPPLQQGKHNWDAYVTNSIGQITTTQGRPIIQVCHSLKVNELGEDITVGIQLGNITFSFKTDLAGSNVKTNVKAIRDIATTHAQLFKSVRSETFGKSAVIPDLSPQS